MAKNSLGREKWSSLLAFVWVASGAAVGLGNVWKFPYMAGTYGGSAFVLLYLLFVALIAMPVMAAEIFLGKLSQKNAVDGFSYLARRANLSLKWRYTGYLGAATLQTVFCFYSVVAGFSIAYIYFGASNLFASKSPQQIADLWGSFLGNAESLILYAFLFIGLTMAIVAMGIKKGIERSCKLMMPALLLVLLVLVVYSSSFGGFSATIDFLFAFEPQKIEGSVVIASLGHAFFTLAVGACAMMVYGSHLPKDASVFKSVWLIALLDVVVAILSGLAIFPLIFENGLSPAQGPGLMFISLPIVFAKMPFAWFFGTLFFLLLFFAALSSALSFAEPLVELLMDKLRIKRTKASLIIGLSTGVGSVFCALSFNLLSGVKIFDRWSIFDFVADLATNLFLPIGGILIAVFAGLTVRQEDVVKKGKPYGRLVYRVWKGLTLYLAPAAILIVMVNAWL